MDVLRVLADAAKGELRHAHGVWLPDNTALRHLPILAESNNGDQKSGQQFVILRREASKMRLVCMPKKIGNHALQTIDAHRQFVSDGGMF